MNTLSKNENLTCDLTVFTSGQREAHIEQAIRLRNAMTGMKTTEDGFKVYFQPTAIPEEILAFAREEQQCCGFLRDAEVYRETGGKERIVLSLKTSTEGASAWTGAFFALAQSPVSPKETAAVHLKQTSGPGQR